jgi:carbamoyl-phosphate synthase large subunit
MPSAVSSTLAGRAPAILRHGRRVPSVLPVRAFTSPALNASPRALNQARESKLVHKRLFTATALRPSAAAVQAAPNPKAYLDSGVIKPKVSVDVKKVLVIGSGGLSIGQAGEFDYSGSLFLPNLPINIPLHRSVAYEVPLCLHYESPNTGSTSCPVTTLTFICD